jgi:hypothetical protein
MFDLLDTDTPAEREYWTAINEQADRWVVAACGTEVPSVRPDGRRVLYVFNPGTGEHGYLDLATDVVEAE